jgi:hydrogenase maturation protein HypF
MQLESLCRGQGAVVELPLTTNDGDLLTSDWQPLLDMLRDASQSRADRAESFHTSMATALARQASTLREHHGIEQVGLCGGVFQNRVLTEQVLELLKGDGFAVHIPQQLPCNDAAISFGQAAHIAARAAED